jgi:hypothetical protein
MTVRPEIEIEAEAQEDDRSPSPGATSLPYALSRQDENHQEDVLNPQLASAQEDARSLVNHQVDVPSLQDAINQEAERKPAANLVTRKW